MSTDLGPEQPREKLIRPANISPQTPSRIPENRREKNPLVIIPAKQTPSHSPSKKFRPISSARGDRAVGSKSSLSLLPKRLPTNPGVQGEENIGLA